MVKKKKIEKVDSFSVLIKMILFLLLVLLHFLLLCQLLLLLLLLLPLQRLSPPLPLPLLKRTERKDKINWFQLSISSKGILETKYFVEKNLCSRKNIWSNYVMFSWCYEVTWSVAACVHDTDDVYDPYINIFKHFIETELYVVFLVMSCMCDRNVCTIKQKIRLSSDTLHKHVHFFYFLHVLQRTNSIPGLQKHDCKELLLLAGEPLRTFESVIFFTYIIHLTFMHVMGSHMTSWCHKNIT